jgi:hypothetical protein
MAEAEQERTKGKKRKASVDAADNLVGKNSKNITRLLLDKAVGGHADSAKLLLSLATPKRAGKDAGKKRCGRSAAQMLAEEPEWREESPEAAAEMNAGSQEPED